MRQAYFGPVLEKKWRVFFDGRLWGNKSVLELQQHD